MLQAWVTEKTCLFHRVQKNKVLCPEWASSDRHFGTSSIVRRWTWPTVSQWQYRPENTSASGFITLHLFGDNSLRTFMLRIGCLCPEWASSNRHLHLFGDNSLRTFMLRMGYLCPEWASSDRQLHLLGDNSFRMFMLRMGIYAPSGHPLTDISVLIPS